jgi:hypothetical protein
VGPLPAFKTSLEPVAYAFNPFFPSTPFSLFLGIRRCAENRLILKPVSLADGVEVVVKETIPKLSHGHDGLIFTCVDTPYVIGEDQHMSVLPHSFVDLASLPR